MRHVTLRLTVALLTFAIGVIAAALWIISTQSQVDMPDVPEVQMREALPTPIETFSLVGSISALTEHGCINTEIYKASDDSELSFSNGNYRSPSRTVREWRNWLKSSEQIVERTLIENKNGKKVGERIVVLWQPSADSRIRASVFWTEGSRSYSICGESLQRVIEFEQHHKD